MGFHEVKFNMHVGIVIQARIGSSRLPSKMILPFFGKKGIFELLISRLVYSDINIPIILATTTNKNDNELVEIAEKYGLQIFRGNEENVLKRFIDTANQFSIKKIIRICADNPFLDIHDLKFLINSFKTLGVDYWCFSKSDHTPTVKTHYGFWGEGVSFEALQKVSGLTNQKLYLEHVTNFIYQNPTFFSIFRQMIPEHLETRNIRLTIDTQKDFELSKDIYKTALTSNISFDSFSLFEFVSKNKYWLKSMNVEILKNSK